MLFHFCYLLNGTLSGLHMRKKAWAYNTFHLTPESRNPFIILTVILFFLQTAFLCPSVTTQSPDAPVFSHPAGTYTEPFDLNLSAEEGAPTVGRTH